MDTYEDKLLRMKQWYIAFIVIHMIMSLFIFTYDVHPLARIMLFITAMIPWLLFYLSYTYTVKKNPAGPVLEAFFAIIFIAVGIIFCLSMFLVIPGIIYLAFGIRCQYEAEYFENKINETIPKPNSNNVPNYNNVQKTPKKENPKKSDDPIKNL